MYESVRNFDIQPKTVLNQRNTFNFHNFHLEKKNDESGREKIKAMLTCKFMFTPRTSLNFTLRQ